MRLKLPPGAEIEKVLEKHVAPVFKRVQEEKLPTATIAVNEPGIELTVRYDANQRYGGGSYGAQCTPDFFGFNAQDELQYRGRLDASRTTLVPNARRDLFEAMKQVAETGHGPADQTPSMGCSIKWKD